MDGGIESIFKLIESQSKICERFTNIERIDPNGGDGAHSIVFIANDSTIKKNKKVILKFFNPQLAENFYRRECFNREAKLLEKLKGQRNILPMVMVLSVLSLSLETPLGAFPIQFSFYASHKAKESIKAYIYNDKSNFLKSINYFRQICKAGQKNS